MDNEQNASPNQKGDLVNCEVIVGDFYIVTDADSEQDLEMIRRYWEQDSNGDWVNSTRDIARHYRLKTSQLAKHFADRFRMSCMANHAQYSCKNCGVGPFVKSRNDMQKIATLGHDYLNPEGICATCEAAEKKARWVLGHLEDKKIDDLAKRYYAGEDCALLVQDYCLSMTPEALADSFPCGLWTGITCANCGGTLTIEGFSQAEYATGQGEVLAHCGGKGKKKGCGHKEFLNYSVEGKVSDTHFGVRYRFDGMNQDCECSTCEKRRVESHKLKLVEKSWAKNHTPQYPHDIDLKSMVALLALTWSRLNQHDEGNTIAPAVEAANGMMPGDHDGLEYVRATFTQMAITVDPYGSALSAFTDDGVSVYLNSAVLMPNITFDGETSPTAKEVQEIIMRMFAKGFWTEKWTVELLPLWREIAIAECMEYAQYKADEYNLPFSCPDKTREVISSLLENFSVANIWYMISAAFMAAAAFYQSGKSKNRTHAANTVPSKMLALAKNPPSTIKAWSRIKELQRCAMSEVLFEFVLGAGDHGFTLCPDRHWAELLERHLARSPLTRMGEATHIYPLPSDEELLDLADEFGDPRVTNLVMFAIAARNDYKGSKY